MVFAACLALIVVTTILHYEVLRLLSAVLLHAPVAPRGKVVIVILAEFAAHCAQILLYGLVLYGLVHWAGAGSLGGGNSSLEQCFYFSAETFTSLGYGDILPSGSLRLIAGAEALNGLLLIGWSASYTYIAMERFWNAGEGDDGKGGP